MVFYPDLPSKQLDRFLAVLLRYTQRASNRTRAEVLGEVSQHAAAAGGRLRSPLTVILDLTNKCNQNCIFCYREGRRGLKGTDQNWSFRSLEELERIFEDLKTMNVPSVALTGGEATCHPRFIDAVAMAKRFGFATIIVTNGTAFKPGQVRELSRLLDPSCDKVELSLDAADPLTYRKIRNSDRYRHLLETLKSFRNYAIPFTTMTLLVRDNSDQALDILHLAIDHAPMVVALEPPFPKAHITDPAVFARPEQVISAYEAVLDCPRLAQHEVTLNFLHFSMMAGVHMEAQRALGFSEKPLAGCHAGHATCTIDIQGDVHLCSYLINARTSYIGNIWQTPLSELWAHAQRARSDAVSICSGGCMAFDFDRTGPDKESSGGAAQLSRGHAPPAGGASS